MTDVHVSPDLLERVARRDARPDEIVAMARHLERCGACAARAREYASRDLGKLRAELTPPPPSRARRGWTIRAAAAGVAVAVALWIARPDAPAPHAPATAPVHVETPRTAAPPAQPAVTPPPPKKEEHPGWRTLVADAKATGTLPFPPDLDELRGSTDVVRGSSGERLEVHPAGTVIEDPRPAFTWPERDAERYVVYVFDGEREILRSPQRRGRSWRPARALPRGRTLSWQVEAIDGERIETIPRPPAPPARFRIAPEADVREIERARTLRPNDPLLHAVLYARAGLRDEALAALRRVPPDDATKELLDRYVN